MGWPAPVNMNCVSSFEGVGMPSHRFAGVRVHVKPRKIAAGNVQSNAVSCLEEIGYGRQQFSPRSVQCLIANEGHVGLQHEPCGDNDLPVFSTYVPRRRQDSVARLPVSAQRRTASYKGTMLPRDI